MDGERRRSRLRSFLLGGLVGSAAGLAAGGRVARRPPRRRRTPAGLAAFERAPCYRELVEEETAASSTPARRPRSRAPGRPSGS